MESRIELNETEENRIGLIKLRLNRIWQFNGLDRDQSVPVLGHVFV